MVTSFQFSCDSNHSKLSHHPLVWTSHLTLKGKSHTTNHNIGSQTLTSTPSATTILYSFFSVWLSNLASDTIKIIYCSPPSSICSESPFQWSLWQPYGHPLKEHANMDHSILISQVLFVTFAVTGFTGICVGEGRGKREELTIASALLLPFI